MPPSLPAPVLTIAPNALKDLDGSDHLSGLWFVFTKCKTSLHEGRRLENISWRLWYRELASTSSYRPLTPDSPSEFATKETGISFSTPKRSTGTSSLSSSSPHQPIGRVIFEMLPSSSPETIKVLNSKLKLPPTAMPTRRGDSLSISIVPPKTESSTSSPDSSPGISPPFTRTRPQPQTNPHSSPSLSSTSNSNHSTAGTGPLVVVVNPTPNPTPHPTPPATPVLLPAALPTSGEHTSTLVPQASAPGSQASLPSQSSLARPSAKFLTPVLVSNIPQTPSHLPIPSSLQPPSPSNDSGSSVSGSPFTSVTDTSANTTSTTPDSTLKPTDAKKFVLGMSHDHDRSSQSSESPTSSQDNDYTSTAIYPYQPHMSGHLHGSGSDSTNTSRKQTFVVNSNGFIPYSNQPLHGQTSRSQSQSQYNLPLQSQHLYPQPSHSQSHYSRSKSQAVSQEQSYAHAHAPYPSNHSVSKIRDGATGTGTVSPNTNTSSFNKAGGSGNRDCVNQGTTKGTGVAPTTTSTSASASASTTAQPNSSSASSSDLRSRNRNQGLPTNGLIGGMNGKSAVSNQGLGYGGGGSDKGQFATRRRESLDSEMSVSWSGSEGEQEGEEERRNKETRGTSVNSSGMSNSIGSTNASGRSVGSRVVGRNRSRGRTEKHSGLTMMSASAKGKKRASGGKLGMPTIHAVSQTSLSTSQPQSQGNGHGDVKSGIDDQARVSGKGKEKEKQASATVSTDSTSGSSGSRDAIQGQAQVVAERKREREQTVTRKSMQQMLKFIGDEGLSNGANGLSSSPSQLHHALAEPGTGMTLTREIFAPILESGPYPPISTKLAPGASTMTTTPPPPPVSGTTRPKMFNIGSHSSDGDHSKSGFSVADSTSTGLGSGSDSRRHSNESSRSPRERLPSVDESPPLVLPPQRSATHANLRMEPLTTIMQPMLGVEREREKKLQLEGSTTVTNGESKSGSRSQSRRSSTSAGSRDKDAPSKDGKQVQRQASYASNAVSGAEPPIAQVQQPQQPSRGNAVPPTVNGVPQLTSDEGVAAATAFVEQLTKQQKNPRKVVITTDNDDDEDDDDDDTLDDGEERPPIEGDDDDSDFVTEESGEEEEEGEWTSDDESGDNEIVVGGNGKGGGSKPAGDARATTVAAGQEKVAVTKSNGQGHTHVQGQVQGKASMQQQQQHAQQPVPGPSGLQRPSMHGRHLSQPNVPTVAGVAKSQQKLQLRMEFEEQQRQLELDQQQLARQQQLQQQQARAPGLYRTSSRRGRSEHDKEELKRREKDIKIRDVVMEAQRQRDMFAKVPERSYSNLTNLARSKSGLLSQLMNPDPQIFPENHPYRKGYSSGDVAGGGVARLGINGFATSSQDPMGPQPQPMVKGGLSRMAPPKTSQGHPGGQKNPTATVKSPPFRTPTLKPNKPSVALPVTAQVTAASVKDTSLVKGKEKVPEIVGSGSKYRPKGRPQDQEMETDSEDEAPNPIQESVTAEEKLKKLMQSNSKPPQELPQRRPSALRQTQTERGIGTQPASPTPIQRSQSQIIHPLGYPYNLPPAPEPSSPRTTRQRMLREEMSESVRQNLLWHRQLSKAVVLGPKRRSSEHSVLAPLTAITTPPPLVHLTKKKTPPDSPADEQSGKEVNGTGGVEGVAMTFHERPVPMTRTRSWAGGGR